MGQTDTSINLPGVGQEHPHVREADCMVVASVMRSEGRPRVCGAEGESVPVRSASTGKPPRMQGSLHVIDLVPVDEGYIPTHVRQKVQSPRLVRMSEVHPRVCGADFIGKWERMDP